jgi:hypothetical protein
MKVNNQLHAPAALPPCKEPFNTYWIRGWMGPRFDQDAVIKSLCLTNWALRHEGVWGSGCIDPRILNFGTSLRWVVSSMPRLLYSREKSPLYPLDRRLVGPQNRSEWRGKEKNLPPYRDSNSDPSAVQPVVSPYTDRAIPDLIEVHSIFSGCCMLTDRQRERQIWRR